MSALEVAREMGHEEVVLVRDQAAGLLAVIAIHDTTLGPAVGGTRMRRYPSLDEAAVDALGVIEEEASRIHSELALRTALPEATTPRGNGGATVKGDTPTEP